MESKIVDFLRKIWTLNLNLLKALLTLVLRDLGDGLSVTRGLFPTALGKKTTWEVEMGGQSGL